MLDVTLEDKYVATSGRVYLTGIQALVRLMLVQRQRDALAGLNTAGFVSGYRGSPLGGLDEAIQAAAALAGLQSDGYRVEYVDQELSLSEAIALQFASTAAPILKMLNIETFWSDHLDAIVRTVLDPLEYLSLHNDPLGLYSYCFCDVE